MAQSKSTGSFISTPGFCSDCGSILPLLEEKGDVQCYACKKVWGPEGSYSFFFFLLFLFQTSALRCVRITRCHRIVKNNCKRLPFK